MNMSPEQSVKQTATSPDQLLNFSGAHSLPMIHQTEAAECGLACLAMIASFHGYETDLAYLRQRIQVSSHGTNLKNLMEMAGRLHLAGRALKLNSDSLGGLQLPCVLHWDLNHFVVLKAVKSRKAIIHDPASGEKTLTKEEFDKHFTGIALELTPTSKFEVADTRKHLKLHHFWSRISGLKRSLLQILVLSLLLQVFAIISPYYMQTVVDDVILRNDDNLLLVLALGFGLLLLIETGTHVLRQWVMLYLSSRLNIQMAANLFRHLIRLPMSYFSTRHMGDVVSRFGSLQNVRELLTTSLVAAVVDGIMAVITLTVMFFYSIKLTLLVLIVVLLYAALRFALYKPLRLLTEEQIIAQARHDTHFMESVRAVQTIKLFQRENDRQGQWQNRLADTINQGIRITRWNIGYDTINRLLFGIENLLVIYFAATAVMGNIFSVGMLYAFLSYKSRFVSSMDTLIATWIELKMLGLHLDRLSDIVFTETEEQDDLLPSQSSTRPLAGKIEVRNLSFQYGETEGPTFQNLNFIIEPGETVAITGPSGCGKTTLLKCLMGLLQPTEGEILIDDRPLKQVLDYRRHIAGVMQRNLP
ncbi:peptidase domain-containing ABC transporter [Cellvibrio japonicus]|uniref:Putative toxin secretion ABC transporter, ATP-binding subunit/permease protein n=1 Tax=Cellvibrio japonicus (strain Ueda107) TaxID=498211 RepID=B3PH77_CELJU|nr:peptidase domain-containing ABC transporter [Cellvibrio japonicus]ACE84953.1 putative toxin secretion ABC transporter, ATP-binding subunit/permease protein [Cellvibrio japonicus Ueda107]QEI11003.1 peptidase domain-containing ABC transporter [Cellvibrio japonicus]QEI14578.1 peptidase domain-containing ABC transporter [Cellvibrio japonicus]QEI18157.1 peptidase domain-containing ABC transporter [Cellvibrio japonicus]